MSMPKPYCPPVPDRPRSRERECLVCDIPPFCRNHYFTGKLLTERDFSDEQRYARDKIRLHYRRLHGWGVVCGLKVKPHPFCPELRLIVEPGLAIDRCGYEIVVPYEIEVALPRPASTTPPKPDAYANPYQSPGVPPQYPQPPPYGTGSQPAYPGPQVQGPAASSPSYQQPPYGGPQTQPPAPYQQNPYGGAPTYPPREPRVPLYVCIRYRECETEFMPAPFDECACNDKDGQQPNRICESFGIDIQTEKPTCLVHEQDEDCGEIYKTMIEPCDAPAADGCLPLAVVMDYAPGDRITPEMIDNWSCRIALPSTSMIDRVLRCLMTRLPGQTVTCVKDIGWTHGQEYHCHDFIRFFTGNSASGPGFEITFDGPVRTEGLTPRTFQAVIVRRHGPQSGGPLWVPPSLVWASPDRTRFYLQIDREYVERELEGHWFDVNLALRCNLILDEHGRAVDGDLLARWQDGTYLVAPPTGNGLPGGTLESWIRVRP